MRTNDPLAALDQFDAVADPLTGMKAILVNRGWTEAAAEALVVALVVKR